MMDKTTIVGYLASLGLLLGMNSGQAIAQINHGGMPHSNLELSDRLQRIEQPLWLKGVVTAGGLGLIGLELWWFLGRKSH
jgi:plastocyanin domain-containing protein